MTKYFVSNAKSLTHAMQASSWTYLPLCETTEKAVNKGKSIFGADRTIWVADSSNGQLMILGRVDDGIWYKVDGCSIATGIDIETVIPRRKEDVTQVVSISAAEYGSLRSDQLILNKFKELMLSTTTEDMDQTINEFKELEGLGNEVLDMVNCVHKLLVDAGHTKLSDTCATTTIEKRYFDELVADAQTLGFIDRMLNAMNIDEIVKIKDEREKLTGFIDDFSDPSVRIAYCMVVFDKQRERNEHLETMRRQFENLVKQLNEATELANVAVNPQPKPASLDENAGGKGGERVMTERGTTINGVPPNHY